MIIKLLITACLSAIFFFDIKYRAVYWWLYVLLFILAVTYAKQCNSWLTIGINTSINIGIILFQLLVLQIYYGFRKQRFEFIFDKAFGIGDVCLFICFATVLSPQNFIFFLVLALPITLILHFLAFKLLRDYEKTVPLAGYLSFLAIFPLLWFNIYQLSL